MKKSLVLLFLGIVLLTGKAFAADDDWDSYGNETAAPAKAAPTDEDKKAVARNIAALAKNPEALKAAANIAKIRIKQKQDAAAAAEQQGF